MKKILFLGFIGCLLLVVLALYAQDAVIAPEKKEAIEKVERYIERHRTSEVKTAFDSFVNSISAPTSAKGCWDGTYKGESITDDFKYKHVITLTLKDGRIVAADYDEVKKDGAGKRNDKKYCEEMKKGSGASPAEAYPRYEKQLLERQDLMKVDAVSGATYSLYRFRSAAVRALLKAGKETKISK